MSNVNFKELQRLSGELPLLIYLAFKGASTGWIFTSSKAIGSDLGISQQTASRKLIILEKLGLIDRRVQKGGEYIKISNDGIELLKGIASILSIKVLEKTYNVITLEGKVVSGLGEGRYYMSLEGYVRQVIKKLGFKPYPGTLNIRLTDKSELMKRVVLETFPPIMIKGFSNGRRTYGDVKAYRAKVNGLEPAALIIPVRTSHKIDIIEVIAPYYLRERLGLKDGDTVKVEVYLQ